MRRVILESPFVGDINKNIEYAKLCLLDCLERNESPLASHLLWTQPGILNDNDSEERKLGIEAGLTWYSGANASVVYTDNGISSGMKKGIERAYLHKVPVIFRSLKKKSSKLLNKKFNKLLVIGYSGSRISKSGKRQSEWTCLCDCGNICNIITGELRKAGTKSCGCLKKNKTILPNGESAFNELFQSYKKAATRRNVSFVITKEQFKILTKENCKYCGSVPSNIFRKGTRVSYIYNGIDRVDNNLGYEEFNCVSCCHLCNSMKSNFTVQQFLSKIKQIFYYNKN